MKTESNFKLLFGGSIIIVFTVLIYQALQDSQRPNPSTCPYSVTVDVEGEVDANSK